MKNALRISAIFILASAQAFAATPKPQMSALSARAKMLARAGAQAKSFASAGRSAVVLSDPPPFSPVLRRAKAKITISKGVFKQLESGGFEFSFENVCVREVDINVYDGRDQGYIMTDGHDFHLIECATTKGDQPLTMVAGGYAGIYGQDSDAQKFILPALYPLSAPSTGHLSALVGFAGTKTLSEPSLIATLQPDVSAACDESGVCKPSEDEYFVANFEMED